MKDTEGSKAFSTLTERLEHLKVIFFLHCIYDLFFFGFMSLSPHHPTQPQNENPCMKISHVLMFSNLLGHVSEKRKISGLFWQIKNTWMGPLC